MPTHDSCIVTPGTLADLDDLVGLEQNTFDSGVAIKRRQWRYHLTKGPACGVLVLRHAGKVAGDVVYFLRRTRTCVTGRIYSLAVSKEHRGKGLGRRLMLECVGALRKAGARAATLEVHVENIGAIGLYESIGFVKARRLVNFYEPGDGWKMRMLLDK